MLDSNNLFSIEKLKDLISYTRDCESAMLTLHSGSDEHEEALQMLYVVRNLLVIAIVNVKQHFRASDFLGEVEIYDYKDLIDDINTDCEEVIDRIITCYIGVINRLDEIEETGGYQYCETKRNHQAERETYQLISHFKDNAIEFESKLHSQIHNSDTSQSIANTKFSDPDLDFLDDFFGTFGATESNDKLQDMVEPEKPTGLVQENDVLLSDGKRYTGWGYYTESGFIPHGSGKKFYSDFEAWGNYIDGELNGPAMDNHHYYMTTGIFKGNRMNGWGITFNRGVLTQFGYFENSQLKTDLTHMVEWFYEKIIKFWDDKKSGMATTYTNKETHQIHDFLVGWSSRKLNSATTRPQMGFNFMLDGTVWVGITDKMDMTGTLMKFQNDGHIVIGKFNKGELVESLSFKDWFKSYSSQPPHISFEVDPNKNYFD